MHEPVALFNKWREWLCGDDVHSIQQQIHRMVWDAAVFNLIRKARELAPQNEDEEVEWNLALSEYILKAYFEMQAMAIRRLLDYRDDVLSLGRLVEQLDKNRHILTRENILEAAGCPYDYEDVLSQGHPGPEFGKACFSEEMHARIDKLCGVDSSRRKQNDKVTSKVIDTLEQRVNKTSGMRDEIVTYVNKFSAHCADLKSRKKEDADHIEISLGKVFEAEQVLCETAAFIAKNILGKNFDQFVVPRTYSILEHLTRPLATEKVLPNLQKEWDAYKDKTRGWANWDMATIE